MLNPMQWKLVAIMFVLTIVSYGIGFYRGKKVVLNHFEYIMNDNNGEEKENGKK